MADRAHEADQQEDVDEEPHGVDLAQNFFRLGAIVPKGGLEALGEVAGGKDIKGSEETRHEDNSCRF